MKRSRNMYLQSIHLFRSNETFYISIPSRLWIYPYQNKHSPDVFPAGYALFSSINILKEIVPCGVFPSYKTKHCWSFIL